MGLHRIAALLAAALCASAAAGEAPGTFERIADMIRPRESHTATLLADGRVLIAGGFVNDWPNDRNGSADAELYDPVSRTFTRTGSMTRVRAYHTAMLLPDGRVLVAGPDAGAVDIYDPATGVFRLGPKPRSISGVDSAALLADGRVLLVGDSSAEIYDPLGDTFTIAAPGWQWPEWAWYTTATSLRDGRVLLVGDGPSLLYDPVRDSFTITGTPNLCDLFLCGLEWHSATLLADGTVLIAGGGNDEYCLGMSNLAELYDPSSGAFRKAQPLRAARAEHRAVRLRDGSVLFVGGQGPNGYCDGTHSLAIAELYDPRTGRFTEAGFMSVGRTGAAATLLRNGDVLVTGGATRCGFDCFAPALASSEVYRVAGGGESVVVRELHNVLLDHYFLTADGAESDAIQMGRAGPGWTSTGYAFGARSARGGGWEPVCRFYGNAAAAADGSRMGPNSHFFTIDAGECEATKRDPAWIYEGIAFHAMPVANGACPDGLRILWRAYNGGRPEREPNHRYATDRTVLDAMRGWLVEGPAMCVE